MNIRLIALAGGATHSPASRSSATWCRTRGYEPNVPVRSEQSRRFGNASFNIRGIDGNRVLMLLDGVRVDL